MSNRKYYTIVFLVLLYCAYNYWDRTTGFHADGTFGCDLKSYLGITPGWMYKDWLRFPFHPLTTMPFEVAQIGFYCFSAVFVIYTVLKLMELPHGFILALVYFKVVAWTLGSGNIDPILAAICVGSAGSLVAVLFKPWTFGFVVIHTYQQRRRHRKKGLDASRHRAAEVDLPLDAAIDDIHVPAK